MFGGMYFSTTSALLPSCDDGAGDVRALVQIDLLDADALVADGLDPRDVVDQRGQLALVQRQDAVLHVLGAHAVVGPDDRNDGDVDFRENVHRHAQCRADPHAGGQDQDGSDRVGPLQRVLNERHDGPWAADRLRRGPALAALRAPDAAKPPPAQPGLAPSS